MNKNWCHKPRWHSKGWPWVTSCVVFKSKIFKIWLISDSDIFKITSRLHLEQIEFTVFLLQAHHILNKSKKRRSVVVHYLWTTSPYIDQRSSDLLNSNWTMKNTRTVPYGIWHTRPRTTPSHGPNHRPEKISPLLFNDVFFIIIVWRIKTIDLKISKWLFNFRNDFRRLNSTGSDGLSFIEIFYKYVQRNSPFIIGKDETRFNHI